MTERPILFSAPMVRALLADTKTQTRRVSGLDAINAEPDRYEYLGVVSGPGEPHFAFRDKASGAQTLVRCRTGQPGDRLWVRETWYCDDYRVQSGPYLKPDDLDPSTMVYRASSGDRPYEAEQPVWRPAIHMPRWASRITLEVTAVRVERLQDISEADAIAEGVYSVQCNDLGTEVPYYRSLLDARALYRLLWESINGPGSWDANHWVWCVEFRRLP